MPGLRKLHARLPISIHHAGHRLGRGLLTLFSVGTLALSVSACASNEERMTAQTRVIRRPATYQDVLDAPPTMVAEIIRGALHLQPRPRPKHARASSVLGARIGGPFDYDEGGPGGWQLSL